MNHPRWKQTCRRPLQFRTCYSFIMPRRVAWFLWLATLITVLLTVLFDVIRRRSGNGAPAGLPGTADLVLGILLILALPMFQATVGLLIAVGRPRNAIGWLFAGAALAFALSA